MMIQHYCLLPCRVEVLFIISDFPEDVPPVVAEAEYHDKDIAPEGGKDD